jgi:hypothetical protein
MKKYNLSPLMINNMKKLKNINLVWIATLLATACGTTTSITGSYKSPEITQVSFKKVFVSALTERASVKQTVENKLAEFLNSKGIVAVKSYEVFPPDFHSSGKDKDKDAVLQKINEKGCDGIMTVALINKETETRYVPGNNYPVGGYPYYGTFGAYYTYGYSSFYSPGYYTNDKTYYLETNVYDAKTEKLVWSAQSKTYDPTSLDSFLEGYEKALTQQVIKDGLVIPTQKK